MKVFVVGVGVNSAYIMPMMLMPMRMVSITTTIPMDGMMRQVSMGPVGIPNSTVLQNGLDNSHTQWSRSLSSGQK